MLPSNNTTFPWQLVLFLFCVYQAECVLQNVALGKPAYQSGSFHTFSVASRAVDGDTNQDMFCKSCILTSQTINAWWDVDLGEIFSIQNVTIYNRVDAYTHRLKDVELHIGDSRSDYRFIQSKIGEVISNYTFDLSPEVLGQWVKITRKENVTYEQLQLCEVEVFADVGPDYFKGVKNVALGKTAYQSDNYYKYSYAQKAVDGDTNATMEFGSCIFTKQTVDAWWDVDLGKTYLIHSVRVFNRNGEWAFKLQDVYLYIGQSRSNYKSKGFYPGQINGDYEFQMDIPTLGQWVKITRTSGIDYGELPICEVQVNGEEVPIKHNVQYEHFTDRFGKGTILKTAMATTQNECAQKCRVQLNNGCIAFNYLPGSQQCELLETFIDDAEVTDSKNYYRMIYV